MNNQKSVVFLHTSNKLSERETKNTMPFTISQRKYLGNQPTTDSGTAIIRPCFPALDWRRSLLESTPCHQSALPHQASKSAHTSGPIQCPFVHLTGSGSADNATQLLLLLSLLPMRGLWTSAPLWCKSPGHRHFISPTWIHAGAMISFVGLKTSPILISCMWWNFKGSTPTLLLPLSYLLFFFVLSVSTQQPNVPRKSLKPVLLQVGGELREVHKKAPLSDINWV